MEQVQQNKIIVYPTAYIKSLMYFQRFTNKFLDATQLKFAYGLFLGYVEETLVITDFIPLKEFNQQYIDFEEYDDVFYKIEQLNNQYYDEQYPEYILGWGRNSLYNDLEPTEIDKKNHLLFQTAINPQSFFWVFSHEELTIGYGFDIYRFKDEFLSINQTSELTQLKVEFAKDVYIDEIIQLAIDIEEKRKKKEPLMKGLEE